MEVVQLRKAFALLAKGLVEKERLLQEAPTRYPYSKTMQHGINLFLAASVQLGNMGDAVFACADEGAFLERYLSRPVAEWFREWDPEAVAALELPEQPFYGYEALAYRRSGTVYTPSSECYEFLETQDRDILAGTDERVLYEKMTQLEQEHYCRVRRFLIEHPILTMEERRAILLELSGSPAARDAITFAYEEITQACYRCPSCGWTLTKGRYGLFCHSTHCTDITPELTDAMRLDLTAEPLFRLKKGIMRYFAQPGKLELEIAAFCGEKKLAFQLWPYLDRYDVELRFPDGEIWEIDAKAYRNPISLRTKIQNDGGFPEGEFARGYYVVPDAYTTRQRNYIAVVNRALTHEKKVRCITMRTLKREINRKEAEILGAEE